MFSKLDTFRDHIAVINDSSRPYSYDELLTDSDQFSENIQGRHLVFSLCSNSYHSLAAYVGLLRAGQVQALFNPNLEKSLLSPILETYRPQYVYLPKERGSEVPGTLVTSCGDSCLIRTAFNNDYALHADLAILLTTSGSTGSPKLVRLSHKNLEHNARAISASLSIQSEDRPITTLPMSYAFGLSILNSHLIQGASIILSKASLVESAFWKTLKANSATTFGGVPYTFEILKKLRFGEMELPSLRYLTQAGGKLRKELALEFSKLCETKRLRYYTMYGQTEATARMSYLPHEYAVSKAGSIGVPIPGGRFWLESESGKVEEKSIASGELVYQGENVSLGYAHNRMDLSRGDDHGGILRTGDLAERDADGFYYVVGRRGRFLKFFGLRVNLNEIEDLLAARGIEAACGGTDDALVVYVSGSAEPEKVRVMLAQLTALPLSGMKVCYVRKLPRNEVGKIQYTQLQATT